jgi:hypothetical protein
MDVIKWGKTRLIAPAAAQDIHNKQLSLLPKPEWNDQFSVDIIV